MGNYNEKIKKIMIIEDNPFILQNMSEIIGKQFYDINIEGFSDLKNVYQSVMNYEYDLFIVDIILNSDNPDDVSGIEFVKKLRGISKYEFTPVIMVTSLLDPKLYAFTNLHVFSYIEKPFREEFFINEIRKALRFPNYKKNNETQYYFRKDGIIYSLKCSEIICAESIHHKIHFHRTDGYDVVVPYKTCRQVIEEINDKKIVQCSRNGIVNIEYIENIDTVNRIAKMKITGKTISIGNSYLKNIVREFSNEI